MTFSLPLTYGQTGTLAELLAIPESDGAMFDTGSPHLDGPAPVGQFIVRGDNVYTGPSHRQGPNAPRVMDHMTRVHLMAPRYAPEDHVVAGGFIGALELFDILETNPGCLDGVSLACSTDYGRFPGDWPMPNERAYYTCEGPQVVPRVGACTYAMIRRSTYCEGWFKFGYIPNTWQAGYGPVHRPPPAPTRPCCPICRVLACSHGCPGTTIGTALGGVAISMACAVCKEVTWSTPTGQCAQCAEDLALSSVNGVPTRVLQFGVELETEGIDYRRQAGQVAKKFRWSAKADGSLRGKHAEVITPPLVFREESLTQVALGARAVRNAGARVSERCGLHVHVDVKYLDTTQLDSLARNWFACQHLVLRAHPRLPYRQKFCEPMKANAVTAAAQYLVQGSHRDYWHRVTDNRYSVLNFQAMARHGTVEFRLWNGTVHAGKVRAYVMFCAHFVAYCSRVTGPTELKDTGGREGMLDLLDRIGLTDARARWHLLGKFQRPSDRPEKG